MSVIRDTATLIERAKEHRKHDRLIHSSYGKAISNGELQFKGCAVGCLAAPVDRAGLQRLARQIKRSAVYEPFYELWRDHGLCYGLVRLADDIFESLSAPYDRNWPLRFAQALPEGVDVTDEMVDEFRQHHRLYARLPARLPRNRKTADAAVRWLRRLAKGKTNG